MDEFNLPLAINKCETKFGVSCQKIAQYLHEYSLFKIQNNLSREFLQLNGFKRTPHSFIYEDEEIEIEAISANLDNDPSWIITANRKQGFTNNRVYVSTAHHYSGNIIAPKRGQKEMGVITQTKETYRIRKLTPRECFRLMGVTDTEIDTIQAAGLSDTRQYQLAGNSIVVDVLAEIFNKMFVDTSISEPKLF